MSNPKKIPYNYSVDVDYTVNSINIAASSNHPQATVSGRGTKNLSVGENTFTITVTRENELGIENYELSVYQNPTNGLITIVSVETDNYPSLQNDAAIQIYDIIGHCVAQFSIASLRYSATAKGDMPASVSDSEAIASLRYSATAKGDMPASVSDCWRNSPFSIDISGLQSGMYYLRVGNETVKIIKE